MSDSATIEKSLNFDLDAPELELLEASSAIRLDTSTSTSTTTETRPSTPPPDTDYPGPEPAPEEESSLRPAFDAHPAREGLDL